MARDLEDKSNLFLKAQATLFRCVRLHNAEWSVAAGFRIGQLYTRLIDDIHNAEVPDDLDEETIAAYREELWKHTGHLARRAVVVFEKNIELAVRLGQRGEWVERSRSELGRMKELIERETKRTFDWTKPPDSENGQDAGKERTRDEADSAPPGAPQRGAGEAPRDDQAKPAVQRPTDPPKSGSTP